MHESGHLLYVAAIPFRYTEIRFREQTVTDNLNVFSHSRHWKRVLKLYMTHIYNIVIFHISLQFYI